MLQPLDRLRRADQPAGAAAHRLALLAHRVGAAGGAGFGKGVRRGVGRAAGEVDVEHLGDDVAGAVDRDGVADAQIAPLADRRAVGAAPGDVVLVVQRRIRDDDAAHGDRRQPRHRRERAGAADLNLDGFEGGDRGLRRELVRDGPARRGRAEAEPLLQRRDRRPCRRRRRCRSRAARAGLRDRHGRPAAPRRPRRGASRGWWRSRAPPAAPARRSGSRPAARRSRPSHRRRSGGAARRVTEESSWRSEPAAALRGLAKTLAPASAWRAFSAAKSAWVM
jgi:hypothetical protein